MGLDGDRRWNSSHPFALRGAVLLALALTVLAHASARAQAATSVTTAGYSNLRDNWDPGEPSLGPLAVRSASFGKLFETQLEGAIYSQPLAYEGDIIVTTEEADAYAVNAATGGVVWKRNLGTPFKSSAIHCSDLTPNLGSTSTPVIDAATGTIYLTTRLLEGGKRIADGVWYLQALSAATGEERPGFPVKIAGTPYNTPGVPFNEHYSQQRPALVLLGGVVYVAFASDCDITPYRGIVVGVNASSGGITTMWSDEAGDGSGEDSQAGIWQSGGGPVSDEAGRIVLATGNGVSPTRSSSGTPPPTLSESVVGLQVEPSGQIVPTQFFAPSNAPELDAGDADLGSGGPIALPGEYFGTKAIPHLIVQVGKDGRIFLINEQEMGGYREGGGEGDDVLQTVGPYGGVWGHPAAYGGQGGWVYILESSGGGYLRALSYGLNGKGQPALTSVATSAESFGYTSGSPLVTSDGATAGSPVVWVVYTRGPSGGGGQLRAYSGTPNEGNLPLLWSAGIGTASKFATPTAYEGVVYVGNRKGDLIAFGALAGAPVQAAPVQLGSVPVGQAAESTVALSATTNFTVTAPVSTSGEQGVPAPQPMHEPSKVTVPTAGPHAIPPSGEGTLPGGVVTVGQPPVGSAVAAGSQLRLRVRFRPTHAGPVVGQLTFHTTAGERTVTFSGYATRPGLLVSAQPLDFGVLRTGPGGRVLDLTVSNSWDHPERITGYTLPGRPFHVGGLPAAGTTLAPQQAVTLSVAFDPAGPGHYRSSLTIHTDHGSVTLPAAGSAVRGRPRLAISPLRVSFGEVPVGVRAVRTFTVGDSGDVPLEVTRAIAPEEPFGASVPLSEGITIEPGVSARVTVSFHPTATGPASGVYLINSTDGHGYYRVQLSGTGT